jgi:hypothetical protein
MDFNQRMIAAAEAASHRKPAPTISADPPTAPPQADRTAQQPGEKYEAWRERIGVEEYALADWKKWCGLIGVSPDDFDGEVRIESSRAAQNFSTGSGSSQYGMGAGNFNSVRIVTHVALLVFVIDEHLYVARGMMQNKNYRETWDYHTVVRIAADPNSDTPDDAQWEMPPKFWWPVKKYVGWYPPKGRWWPADRPVPLGIALADEQRRLGLS